MRNWVQLSQTNAQPWLKTWASVLDRGCPSCHAAQFHKPRLCHKRSQGIRLLELPQGLCQNLPQPNTRTPLPFQAGHEDHHRIPVIHQASGRNILHDQATGYFLHPIKDLSLRIQIHDSITNKSPRKRRNHHQHRRSLEGKATWFQLGFRFDVPTTNAKKDAQDLLSKTGANISAIRVGHFETF